MAPVQTKKAQHQVPTESALAGLLALFIDERENRVGESKGDKKTEVVLASAGMSIDDIAAVTGKKRDAVRMAIQRGRAQ